MKKMLIAMAAIAVIGMGAAVADGYWGCVADSIQTGADAGAQKANEYGISDSVTKNASIAGGAIGGAAAGIINCE